MDARTPNAALFSPATDDVFARIAGRYDLLCDLFSLGAHRLWKGHMARCMALEAGRRDRCVVLDVAAGTGDIPRRLAPRLKAGARLWVTDLSPAMLEIAARNLAAHGCVEPRLADAEDLRDVADGSVDLLSISFGMKICNRERVVAEALRVLAPGGAFFCLEASNIPVGWAHRAYLAYMDWCLPMIAVLAARGDRSTYDYLLRGIHDFPAAENLTAELTAAGFAEASHRRLTFGIVALHRARKPG